MLENHCPRNLQDLCTYLSFCPTERDPTLEIRYRHKKSKEKDREGERERAEKDELRLKAQELAMEQSRSSKVR